MQCLSRLQDGYELEFNGRTLSLGEANDLPPSALADVFDVTVARPGYGRITFLGPTDLRSGMDFAGLVAIGDKKVRVYPEDYEDKPPLGEGLNKPSVVEMHNYHLTDKHGARVTSQEKMERALRKLSAAQGVEYLGYDIATGVYTFKAFHWSE